MSGKLEYDGRFKRPASPLGFGLRAFASGIEEINFFRLGNDTPEQTNRQRFRSQQTVLLAEPAVRLTFSRRLTVVFGPQIRYSRSGEKEGSLLFEEKPYGTGDFGLVALRGGLELDTRNATKTSLLAVATGAATGDPADLPPGRGLRAVASGSVVPAAWSVTERYGTFDGYLAGYVGSEHTQLAARVGGQRLFGAYPWFDAAFIGGRNDRGYHSHRFAGDASLYGNVELRAYFGRPRFQSIFPVRLGVVVFADAGRVWLEGENSRRWHPSAGGGLLLKPVGTGIVVRAAIAAGSEGPLLYVGSGFRF
jgi:hypothetical protein